MPVRKDPDGRRWVQAEAEVPGTPEDVWDAIASGPGVSSWFVPTRIEQREGGAIVASFGPGMDSRSTITSWEPPHRFTADSPEDMGQGAPAVASEWTVEAKDGGTCVVRVVHSWFASTDDWDNQYEGTEQGWIAFFRILRLYLAHFKGQPCAAFQVMGVAPGTPPEAWQALTDALGTGSPALGARVTASAEDAPPLAGLAETVGPDEHPELLLRLDQPAPGLAHLFAMPMGQTYLSMRVFLYGERAAAVAAVEEPRWQAWFSERFPFPAPEAAPDPAGSAVN